MIKDRVFVLDTNAYVYMTKKDWRAPNSGHHANIRKVVADIRAKERSRNCIAVASPDVALELASIMGGSSEGVLSPAAKALAALGEHCEDAKSVRFVAGMTESICARVFELPVANYKESCDAIASVSEDLLAGKATPQALELGAKAHVYVEKAKAAFVKRNDHLAMTMRAAIAAGVTDSEVFKADIIKGWGSLQIQIAADVLGMTCGKGLIDTHAPFVAHHYRVAGMLYAHYLSRIYRMKTVVGRELQNYLWDLRIAAAVGPDHAIGGRSSVLVTSDRRILNAASDAGLADGVLSYEAYIQEFGKSSGL